MDRTSEQGPLLTATEVAKMFGVAPKTVVRWAKDGKLRSIRTPGGRHRFRETEVRNLARVTRVWPALGSATVTDGHPAPPSRC